MDYPGKVITKTQVTPTQTSASGNWTLDDQAAAIKNNNWPVALVPNPISKSLRFNSADTAYLNRTPASAGNRKTWTWSAWVKRSVLGTPDQVLFSAYTDGNNEMFIRFNDTNSLYIYNYQSASLQVSLTTTALYRDTSAWYHVIVALDTTQATSTDRVKVYVNGIQVTSFSTTTYPSLNLDCHINAAVAHNLGRRGSAVQYLNGYMTEVNFIDGQALTPSSFGMTNPQTGQWIPLKYSGTYGTNGFYLNFKDATSTTTLGYDYSGNANNWTTNNFSVTAGAGNDSLTDVPTPWFAYNTTGDVGGVIRGNYATLNPLFKPSGTNPPTLSEGNLKAAPNAGAYQNTFSTTGASSGKWYAEIVCEGTPNSANYFGVGGEAEVMYLSANTDVLGATTSGFSIRMQTGDKRTNGTNTSYGTGFANGDIMNIALNLDSGKVWFGKNGTWFASGDPASGSGEAFSGLSGVYFVGLTMYTGGFTSATANFGQRPFAYTPPTGFRSLCTTNLPATAIGFGLTNQGDDYFNANLYTGTGSAFTLTGVGFQPDFGWFKGRNASSNHWLHDVVRGANPGLSSNSTAAEDTTAGQLTAFASDGYSLPNDTAGYLNFSGRTMVVWSWKAGGTGVSNTAGTITSTVSANTTAGFSIVTYTGNGSATTKVGHGLGVAPSMMIVKQRGSTTNWAVYHASLPSAFGVAGTQVLTLNATTANTQNFDVWDSNNTEATRFSVGASTLSNANGGTYVAYCFAAVPGYSAFGSYTGNGSSDGPFVFLGFRPRFVMIKRTDSTANWEIWDTTRSVYNQTYNALYPNLSDAEDVGNAIDINSNGFKLRDTGGSTNSTSSATYIYACFAEFPFQFANAR